VNSRRGGLLRRARRLGVERAQRPGDAFVRVRNFPLATPTRAFSKTPPPFDGSDSGVVQRGAPL
jgi:hypothetical protein